MSKLHSRVWLRTSGTLDSPDGESALRQNGLTLINGPGRHPEENVFRLMIRRGSNKTRTGTLSGLLC